MAKIDEVKKQFKEAAGKLLDSEYDVSEFLEFSSRMYKMSFSDALLLYNANPDIEKAAELKVWNKLGRRVKRGSHAVAVIGENNSCRYLFDYNDTIGKEIGRLWYVNTSYSSVLRNMCANEYNLDFEDFNSVIEYITADNYDEQREEIEETCENMNLTEDEASRYERTVFSFARYIAASRCEYGSNISFTNRYNLARNISDMQSLIETPEELSEMFLHIHSISRSTIAEIEQRVIDVSRQIASGRTVDEILSVNNSTDLLSDALQGGENVEIPDYVAGREIVIENENVEVKSETAALPFKDEIIDLIVDDMFITVANDAEHHNIAEIIEKIKENDISERSRGAVLAEYFENENHRVSGQIFEGLRFSYITAENGITVRQSDSEEYFEEMTFPWSAIEVMSADKLLSGQYTVADTESSFLVADLQNALSNISDETASQLINAFDGATLPDWERGDNQPKINRIKRSLYNILGNEEQTEKAFALIAKQKYNVDFNVSETREPINRGSLTMQRVGSFYEMYGADAEIAADVLNIHLLTKNGEHMVGFPIHVKDEYSDKLSENGYEVITKQNEQTISLMSDAAEAVIAKRVRIEPKSVTMEFHGDSRSLDEINSFALSLGAITVKDSTHDMLSVDTYDNHREELENLAYMNDVTCEVRENTAPDTEISQSTESTIRFGKLGNGTTVYDISRIDSEINDYPTVAHISDEGTLTVYDDNLSDRDMERITAQAQSERDRFMGEWNKLSPEQQYQRLLDRADTTTMLNISGETLSMEQKIEKYMPFVILKEGERPPVENADERVKVSSAFEKLYANHDFSGDTLAFLERTEKQMSINGYTELDPKMYRLPLFERSYGNISRINNVLFDGKLKDVIDELNGYLSDGRESDRESTVSTADESAARMTVHEMSETFGLDEEKLQSLIDRTAAYPVIDVSEWSKQDLGDCNNLYDSADRDKVLMFFRNVDDSIAKRHVMSKFYTFLRDYIEESAKEKSVTKVSDLSVGDVILYEGKRREVEKLDEKSISLRDLDMPDFGGVLLGYSDVLAYNGWQEEMERKGFTVLSKKENEDNSDLVFTEKPKTANRIKPINENDEQLSFFENADSTEENELTADEIVLRNEGIIRGSGFENGKNRIYDFYTHNQPDNSEFAKRLKKEYGIGGRSGTEAFTDYNSTGITLSFYSDKRKVHFSWEKVAKHTADLIEKNEYFTEKERSRTESQNSEVQTAETPAKKKIPNTLAHRNFVKMQKMFPEIMNRTHTYEHYESADESGYEPLSVEWRGRNTLTLAHYYIQYGDMMFDPSIDYTIDFEKQTAEAVTYEQSGLGIYNEYPIGSKMQKDCNRFTLTWLDNIAVQERYLQKATVLHEYNGETWELEVSYNPDGEILGIGGNGEAAKDYNEKRSQELSDVSDEEITNSESVNADNSEDSDVRNLTPETLGTWNGEDSRIINVDEETQTATVEVQAQTENGIPFRGALDVSMSELKDNFAEYVEPIDTTDEDSPKPTDYVFDEANISIGGAKTRYRANIEAIKTLKKIESDNLHYAANMVKPRFATAEEQAVMAKYVGWGGLSQAFDPGNNSWQTEYKELKELLTEEEYKSARSSTNTSFYTPPEIIDGIYQALSQFGFEKGNVLEPSCGIGNFFAKMPQDMKDGSNVYGVELDSISGRIAKELYPNANIQIKGFEKTKYNDNSFDVVIGNVPFGNYKIADKRYDKYNLAIHDYFLAKSIDQIKPGGIIAVTTSKFTMDKQGESFRTYLAERCELMGAVRLPNDAFKNSAGTETTTDILFLQKREHPTTVVPEWVHLGKTEDGIPCNAYFAEHPEMILGKMARDERMIGRYGEDSNATTCLPDDDFIPLKEKIAEAVSHINGKFKVTENTILVDNSKAERIAADPTVRNFTHTLIDGKLYFRENEIMTRVSGDAKTLDRMIGLHKIRVAQRNLINAESEGCTDEAMSAMQRELNTTYDKFVSKYGIINSKANKCFENDDDYNTLQALEIVDESSKTASKAPIFYKRTINPPRQITSVDTAEEALQVSLDRLGEVDVKFMAEISGKEAETVIEELGNRIFLNPAAMSSEDEFAGYEDSSEYLSGNVRNKLRLAQSFVDSGDTRFEKNVKELTKVVPETIPAEDISVRISTPWVTCEDYNRFFAEYTDTDTSNVWSLHIMRSPDGEYRLQNGNDSSYALTNVYGTPRMSAQQIFVRLLNQRDVVVKDRVEDEDTVRYVTNEKETRLAKEKARQMEQAFKDWIFNDIDRREKYVEKYNEIFNSTVGRKYDGSFQSFDGMNPEIELRPHQKDAVMRAKLGGNTLFAHVVGAGKSFEMTAATMEKKRLGLINKACVVVPKPLVEQMGREWQLLYPNANILVAGKNDFTKENRRKFIARCATGDYDAIIMSHNQFEKISMSYEYKSNFIQNQIDELDEMIENTDVTNWRTADDNRQSVKSLERQKKSLTAQLEKLLDTPKDESLTFEQLGIDFLVVDEAHYFKNCFIKTKMGNISGVQTSASKRSEDMLMKCDFLNEKYGYNNIIFSTGTPISNSMTEMYVMQRYLRPDILKEAGIYNFDDWAAEYGEVVTKLEAKPAGDGLQMKRRFSLFVNLPELTGMFKEFADIKTADMIDLPVPKIKGGEPIIVTAKPDEYQKAYMAQLVDRTEDIHNGLVKPTEDNMLKITHEARLLGLDSRCFFPDAKPTANSKFSMLMENALDIYDKTEKDKGVQVIFCDIAVNSKDGSFSVYEAIKEKLIDEGIPEEEICFASEGEGKKSTKLYEQLRNGDKRFVIGSTSKLGTGVNIQNRLCAIHHLDIPWKPSDYEQRNGRGIRQGNMFDEVAIYHYVTQDTFDTYMMDTIVRKSRFTNQIMTSKLPARVCEDVDEFTLTYAKVQAATTSNPYIAERIELDSELQVLKMLKAEHTKKQYDLQKFLERDLPQKQESYAALLEKAKSDENTYSANKQDTFSMTIGGKLFEDKEKIVKELEKARMLSEVSKSVSVGKYSGFEVLVEKKEHFSSFYDIESPYSIVLQGELKYSCDLGIDNGLGNTKRIANLLENDLPNKIKAFENSLDKLSRDEEAAKKNFGSPFPREEELKEKESRFAFLTAELSKSNVNLKEEDETQYVDDTEEKNEAAKSKQNIKPKSNQAAAISR